MHTDHWRQGMAHSKRMGGGFTEEGEDAQGRAVQRRPWAVSSSGGREEQGGQLRQGWRAAWKRLQVEGALRLEPAVWTGFMVK